MISFDYVRPQTLAEACAGLSSYGDRAKILAGGTDLLVQLRQGDKRWKAVEVLMDCAGIEELKQIQQRENQLEIGAFSTYTEIERSATVLRLFPFLAQAARTVGATQIRNLGTIGGGICNGSPASDPLTPLIAVDANARLVSQSATREVPLQELYAKGGLMNIRADEILTHFILPILPEKTNFAFVKLGRRKALAISRMNMAVALRTTDAGLIEDARIAPGCIFSTPTRVKEAEELLLGHKPSDELFLKAGQCVSSVMITRTGVRWSTEYKQPVVEALTERALRQALEAKR